MSPGLKTVMALFSDVVLIGVNVVVSGIAIDATRVAIRLGGSDGGRVRLFAVAMSALEVFLAFFSVVYWDRRFDVWPWADLNAVMGFEWYWLPRLILVTPFWFLWRKLKP
jgi:hypothetical protein